MKNRLIAFILVLFMVVGMLAGCTEKTPEPDPVPPQDDLPEQNSPQDDVISPAEYV